MRTTTTMNRILRLAALAALLVPGTALAGGFGISEFGSAPSGRGYAAAALHEDSSVVFYNPANVAVLEGMHLTLGAAGLMPRFHYEGKDGANATDSEATVVPPPHLTATWQLGDFGIGPTGVGLGFYVPYGSTFSWPEDWAGREEIETIGLTVFELHPVLAVRPHKMVSVGMGYRLMPAQVYLKQGVNFGTVEKGTVELAGSGFAHGASAGVSIFPADGISLALTWRSGATVKGSGVSDYQFPAPFDTEAHDRDVETEIPLAQVFRFGAAVDVMKGLNVSADVEYQQWSAYKELKIDFLAADGSVEESVSSPRDSKDSLVLHLGAEYAISGDLKVRAGYIWDQKTLPEETVNPAPPDSDKHVISLGASYRFTKELALHAHFANAFLAKRTSNTASFPGTWEGAWPGGTMAYLFGLSLTADLDVGPVFGAKTADAAPAPTSAPTAQ